MPATFSDPEVQSCLIGDPLQVEIRSLAEEVRGLRLGLKQPLVVDPSLNRARDLADSVLAEVFPRARELGLSWGQARLMIELVLAGRETDAQSYIANTGAAGTEVDGVLRFIRDRCRR